MIKMGDSLVIRGTRFEVEKLHEDGPGAPFVVVTTPERPGMESHRFFIPIEIWKVAAQHIGALKEDPAQWMENIVRSFGPSLPGPEKAEERGSFLEELRGLINRHSAENGSDTPDFLLAAYLYDCLVAFDRTVRDRERWYGRAKKPIAFQRPHLEQREDKRGAWEKGGFSPRQVGMPEEKE